MQTKVSTIHLGKNGITPNFINTLKSHFDNHQNVKVSVLKSAREDRNSVKKYSKEILEELGPNYTARVVGFTIAIKKWRRAQR